MRNNILGMNVNRVIRKNFLPCFPIDNEKVDYDTG